MPYKAKKVAARKAEAKAEKKVAMARKAETKAGMAYSKKRKK